MLTRLDAWMVGCVERWCHRWQRLTGQTHFVLIRIVEALSCGLLVLDCALEPSRFTVWVNCVLILIYLVDIFWLIGQSEQRALTRVMRQVGNPEKISRNSRFWRLAFLWFICLDVLLMIPRRHSGIFHHRDVVQVMWAITVWWRLLLDACDPLPPCAGKIREWLARLSLRPAVETNV